jgi:hypothetical protein
VITLYDILYIARRSFLFDSTPEYKWTDKELTTMANLAEREACSRALLIKDKTTAAYCSIAVTAGTATYTLDQKVLRIERAKLALEDEPIDQITKEELDVIQPDWQSPTATGDTPKYLIAEADWKLTLVPTPIVNDTLALEVSRLPKYDMAVPEIGPASFGGSDDSIGNGAFLDDGYLAGMSVYVGGRTASNSGTYTITAVDNTILTVTETLTDETVTSGAIISSIPEIPERYRMDLIPYICHLAHTKPGKSTYDPNKSAAYLQMFAATFGNKRPAGFERAQVTKSLTGTPEFRNKYRI